jgi:hypothetical protein
VNRAVLLLAAILLATAACSGKQEPAPPSAVTPAKESPAPAPALPSTLTDVNVAAADMGGAVEALTGNYDALQANYGPGLTGRRLIDGLVDPAWLNPADWNPNRMFSKSWGWAAYPTEAVFSFYERMPALVGGVIVVAPAAPSVQLQDDPSTAPKDVEVWTSMDERPEHFVKAAAATLETTPGEHPITFPAREARFVKLRVLTGASQRVLEIAEVRVLEAARDGYVPLFTRAPGARLWKGSPREGAQRGLDWLQQSAVDWNEGAQGCVGCHVQAQAIMGQQVALERGYRVSFPALDMLVNRIRVRETPEGTWVGGSEVGTAAFAAMGLARADEITNKAQDPHLFRAVDLILKSVAPDGSVPAPNDEPPILQGETVITANALVAFKWAAAHSKDPKYAQAADRALGWIAASEPVTTQDKTFKIISLMRYGTPEQKRMAWSIVETLAAEQQADGGWKEATVTDGSNAFATGQVLYAFKRAGVSVSAPNFKRGTDFLLHTQVGGPAPDSGSWKAVHTQSQRKSDFAPTMWAVIGLAGSYGPDPVGALQVTRGGSSVASRNLEVLLDVSGSMNTKLGEGTRWTTALSVLDDVLSTLPDDMNVGLRVYGHRYSSKSAQTCSDTELLVPVARLDRARLSSAAAALKPRGETPLIRSILETLKDLKSLHGGSVILITDGEESCHGDPKMAAARIKEAKLNVQLNIVGFTLTGETVKAQLGALAQSTGGRYYGAQDGAQLSRALKLAAMQRLPYDILDPAGRVVASGETSELARELPAGQYRLRMNVLGEELQAPAAVVANETTALALDIEGDRVLLRPRK